MWTWLQRWRSPPVDERLLALKREIQQLRLELAERDRVTAQLRRQGEVEEGRVASAGEARRERLLSEAAAPVAQLLTQAHLLEVDGRPVQARDVLAVARRLVRLLEDEGLMLEGTVGQKVVFDPGRHDPLSAEALFTAGQPVIVRLVGVSYQGRILRKAGVDQAET